MAARASFVFCVVVLFHFYFFKFDWIFSNQFSSELFHVFLGFSWISLPVAMQLSIFVEYLFFPFEYLFFSFLFFFFDGRRRRRRRRTVPADTGRTCVIVIFSSIFFISPFFYCLFFFSVPFIPVLFFFFSFLLFFSFLECFFFLSRLERLKDDSIASIFSSIFWECKDEMFVFFLFFLHFLQKKVFGSLKGQAKTSREKEGKEEEEEEEERKEEEEEDDDEEEEDDMMMMVMMKKTKKNKKNPMKTRFKLGNRPIDHVSQNR